LEELDTVAVIGPANGGSDHAGLDVSVVVPCLDEAESVTACVVEARRGLEAAGLRGEVLVVDNGSADGSAELAGAAGARVLTEPRQGYGSAYLAGFAAARGRYVVMADADGTYDLEDLGRFVEPLDDGADMVIGSRLNGRIHPGAMPWLHRRVGNPVLTRILNLLYGTRVSDAHCGMRAFRRSLLARLRLKTTGMELASEQIIRAGKLGLDIRELPIEYRPRAGRSKLSPFPDGWRHLRLLLVHSPTWLFLIPGAALLAAGLVAGVAGIVLAAAALAVIGCQLLQFGVFARSYAAWHLDEPDALFERVRARLSLEAVLLAGVAAFVTGLVMAGAAAAGALGSGIGALSDDRLVIVGLTVVVIGIQVLAGGFFLSVLGLGRRTAELAEPGLSSADGSGPRRG
jgi:Glycosyl transferase family 2